MSFRVLVSTTCGRLHWLGSLHHVQSFGVCVSTNCGGLHCLGSLHHVLSFGVCVSTICRRLHGLSSLHHVQLLVFPFQRFVGDATPPGFITSCAVIWCLRFNHLLETTWFVFITPCTVIWYLHFNHLRKTIPAGFITSCAVVWWLHFNHLQQTTPVGFITACAVVWWLHFNHLWETTRLEFITPCTVIWCLRFNHLQEITRLESSLNHVPSFTVCFLTVPWETTQPVFIFTRHKQNAVNKKLSVCTCITTKPCVGGISRADDTKYDCHHNTIYQTRIHLVLEQSHLNENTGLVPLHAT